MNKFQKQYIKEVKSFFPVMGKSERKYIADLSRTIDEYCMDTAISNKEELYKTIGAPNEVACNYINNLEPTVIIKRIRFSNWIKRLSMSIIIALFLYILIHAITTYNAYKVFEQEAFYFKQTEITE
ncbi:MAG: hypothetical protein E7265_09690 [Lachnospiraceae bacterium]|nr:hypothetical protein [Lachnospiraceae bacterium]